MPHRTFSVSFLIQVDENNNILGSYEDAHTEDVSDLISDTFYDVDDVNIISINVRERET
jgi:hypothetical protein